MLVVPDTEKKAEVLDKIRMITHRNELIEHLYEELL